MKKTFTHFGVYVFPDGFKRLSWNCSGLELKQLTLKHGKPTRTIESYEEVQTWNLRRQPNENQHRQHHAKDDGKRTEQAVQADFVFFFQPMRRLGLFFLIHRGNVRASH
mgnify:CR=1 FL=1